MSNLPNEVQESAAERLRGRLMQQSLTQLLNRVRGARDVLPHLAALENSLGRHGASVIATIPSHGLARICSQLSSLPLPKDDPPLHDLLTRLMDALEANQPTPQYLSTFDGEATLVIEDVSHSEFMGVAMAHADTVPTPMDETGRHVGG